MARVGPWTLRRLIPALIVLHWLGVAGSSTPPCPQGLPNTSKMVQFRDLCYQFVSVEKYWPQARDYCLQNGGRLIKLDSPELDNFIRKTLSELWWENNGIWIGLHDTRTEQVWEWTGYNKDSNEPSRWTNWESSHPGPIWHKKKDCVKMVRNRGLWKWEETYCDSMGYTYRSICQYKAITDETTAASLSITTVKSVDDVTSVDSAHREGAIEDETSGLVRKTTVVPADGEIISETTEEAVLAVPRQAEIRSDLEKDQGATSGVSLWLIVALCCAICFFILVSVCVVVRYRRVKTLALKNAGLTLPALDRRSQAQPTSSQDYANRPTCPLPAAPYPENTYYSHARDNNLQLRAESNIYLNSASMGVTYCPMNQSTSSIDKLPPAPTKPVRPVTYATPLRNHDSANCNESAIADEYLCPSDVSNGGNREIVSGYDVMNGYDVSDDYEVSKEMEYDQPKVSNLYAEIPEVFYNNLYEALIEK